jgi:hypothetical protein
MHLLGFHRKTLPGFVCLIVQCSCLELLNGRHFYCFLRHSVNCSYLFFVVLPLTSFDSVYCVLKVLLNSSNHFPRTVKLCTFRYSFVKAFNSRVKSVEVGVKF